jgi:hypothetical protein
MKAGRNAKAKWKPREVDKCRKNKICQGTGSKGEGEAGCSVK